MNRQMIIAAGAMLLTGVVALAAAFTRARSGTVFEQSAQAEAAAHAGGVNDVAAGATDSPDASRDVLISARRAPRAPALASGTWIGSDPLTLDALRGRVVVVDFWTFGCYNCRNTLPTLKRWNTKYSGRGLTIIGVHAPESDYEKNTDNVRRAIESLGIHYPVVTDEDYETWRAYNVEAWPTTVILDKEGRIRFTHIGEGMYDEMENVIQKLLAEEVQNRPANAMRETANPNNNQGAATTKRQVLSQAKRRE